MIDVRVNGDLEIQVRMESVHPAAIRGAMEAIAEIDVELARYIVFEKLHGQVLNRITGQLADSIETFPVVVADDTVTGGVYQNDGRAPYGKYQEFGAEIPERFGPMRFVTHEGNVVFTMHARAFRLPARPFMGPSAAEYYETYQEVARKFIITRLNEEWGLTESYRE